MFTFTLQRSSFVSVQQSGMAMNLGVHKIGYTLKLWRKTCYQFTNGCDISFSYSGVWVLSSQTR